MAATACRLEAGAPSRYGNVARMAVALNSRL